MFSFGICVSFLAVFAASSATAAIFQPFADENKSVFFVYKDNDNTTSFVGAVAKTYKEEAETTVIMVTAAKCVQGIQASRLSVSIPSSQKVGTVNWIVVHPYYKPPNVDYNIAVLKVAWPMEEKDKVKSLPLSKDKVPNFNGLFTVVDPTQTPKQNVTLVEWKSCQSKVGIPLSSKMICVAVQNVRNGAALITVKQELAGVAFFGGQGPTVFTNIANSEILSFIEKHK